MYSRVKLFSYVTIALLGIVTVGCSTPVDPQFISSVNTQYTTLVTLENQFSSYNSELSKGALSNVDLNNDLQVMIPKVQDVTGSIKSLIDGESSNQYSTALATLQFSSEDFSTALTDLTVALSDNESTRLSKVNSLLSESNKSIFKFQSQWKAAGGRFN